MARLKGCRSVGAAGLLLPLEAVRASLGEELLEAGLLCQWAAVLSWPRGRATTSGGRGRLALGHQAGASDREREADGLAIARWRREEEGGARVYRVVGPRRGR